jgi:hypothetical protein
MPSEEIMSREAMQIALDALEANLGNWAAKTKAVKVLRQALETEQEPVAWMFVNEDGECEQIEYGPVFDDPGVTPLYASPPKREWVGLTDEEHDSIKHNYHNLTWTLEMFARAIEQALKEKNHG